MTSSQWSALLISAALIGGSILAGLAVRWWCRSHDARRDRRRRRAAVVIRARVFRLHKISAARADGNPAPDGLAVAPDHGQPVGPTTTLMSGAFLPVSGVVSRGGDRDVHRVAT